MEKAQGGGKLTVRYGYPTGGGRSPTMFSDMRDGEALDLLNILGHDWLGGPGLSQLKSARRSGSNWTLWGQVVYLVGSPGLAHLSQSPHHYEEIADYVTVTADQLDQILSDFDKFLAEGVPFQRTY